jgi:hypothetical protein
MEEMFHDSACPSPKRKFDDFPPCPYHMPYAFDRRELYVLASECFPSRKNALEESLGILKNFINGTGVENGETGPFKVIVLSK